MAGWLTLLRAVNRTGFFSGDRRAPTGYHYMSAGFWTDRVPLTVSRGPAETEASGEPPKQAHPRSPSLRAKTWLDSAESWRASAHLGTLVLSARRPERLCQSRLFNSQESRRPCQGFAPCR